nr:glycerol-3-phosphate acyltransferase [Quercus suber]
MSATDKDSSPDLAILGDELHLHPSGVSSPDPAVTPHEYSLMAPYARFRGEPVNAMRELGLHVYGEGWRSYDNPVGQKIFYPGFSELMKSRVMKQKRLQRKISELAQKRVEVELHEGQLGQKGLQGEEDRYKNQRLARRKEIEEQLNQVAEDWTDKMICKMDSRYFIRGAYYLCTQLLTRAYHQGIHVSSDEVLRLRDVAAEAERKKQSIIFLPCHRSHVDYVSLQLICFRLGLALPTVVAGDNLNFPVVGPFLQHAGAMWIRRSFGEDQLYTTLVQSYMDTLLQNGHNIECFVEGGRSRTGKLLPPKFGILGFLLESILSNEVDDAIVCPVSTQYDKVIEVDSYISELLGQPKVKEDFAGFLSASKVLSLKLGRVDVRFHEPWSLRDFVNEQHSLMVKRQPDVEVLYDTAFKRRVLSTLGYKVLKDINDVSVMMPTALVGTVLLTLRGRGVGKSELVRRVEWLTARVKAQGGRVAHFANVTTEEVIARALAVLGPKLVGQVSGLPEETFFAEDRFQLSFYRNMTIHLFITQALVCCAVYTKVKRGGGPESQRISHSELADYVFFLSSLFRAEFIFPTSPLEENILTTLEGLERDNILATTRGADGAIDFVELHPAERASGRENFDFYCFLLWPFIEASWLASVSLFMLVPPPDAAPREQTEAWLDLNATQNQAQLLGKTLYHQGDLSYFEAVNKEALKNAFARSEEEGTIVVVRARDKKVPVRVRLGADWRPTRDAASGRLAPAGRLWDFCERVGESRREGKNRRDGATVRTRVLGLVELVGRELWTAGVVAAPPKADKAPGLRKKTARRGKALRTRSLL